MNAHGIVRVAGVIALQAEEGPCFNEYLECSHREFFRDERVSLRVGHMCVIDPDLAAGLEWVVRYTDDDRRFPVCLAGEVTRVGRDHRRNAYVCAGEDVDPLVVTAGAKGIAPDETDQAIGWEDEGCVAANGSYSHHQFGARGRIAE